MEAMAAFHERMWTMLPSKMVMQRQRTALALQAAVTDGAGLATAALERAFQEVIREGETMPDLRLLQEFLARKLEVLGTNIVAADEEAVSETAENADLRQVRATAANAVHEALFKLRALVSGLYGSTATNTLLGLGSRLPRDPMVLHRLAQRALAKVAEPGFQAPATNDEHVVINLAGVVRRIEEPAAELARLLVTTSLEKKTNQRTVIRKRDRMGEFDRGFRGTAGMLKAMYVLAGMDELARKVRPSIRRAIGEQPAQETPTPPGAGAQPTADPPSA